MKKNLPWQLLLLAFFAATFTSYGQTPGNSGKKQVPGTVLEHLKKNKQKLQLEDADFAELEVSSATESKKSGVKHYYLKQLHQGIEIHGAVTTFNLDRNENVISMGNRFHKQVAKKVKTKQVGLSAEAAVAAAANYLKTPLREAFRWSPSLPSWCTSRSPTAACAWPGK
jgi:Zn-dependent metalloprotease